MKCQDIRAICLILLLPFCLSSSLSAQSRSATAWTDSVIQGMSLDEKIGQLFILTAYSNQDESDYQYLQRMVERYHPGGLIFMQGTPEKQVELINRYQAVSEIPLLISQDAEWGLSMRLRGTQKYPRNMTLGAVQSDSLIYHFGRQMARELRRVGVHMNFAPVADINNNPANPVINDRSFGEEKFNVTRKAYMTMKGMQDGGVLACAKHFPGHGDTGVDSHFDLPVLNHSLERLDTLELYPFHRLMQGGISSVMVAHLHIPALDPTPDLSASLSRKIIHDLLRERMNYQGLIITDALNMHGVTKYFGQGEVALEALLAGNDLLLSAENIPASIAAIQSAITSGRLSEAELDEHVRRILLAKHQLGIARFTPISTRSVRADILTTGGDILRKQLFESAITLAKNDGGLVPIGDLEGRKIAYLQVGGPSNSDLSKTLQTYAGMDVFFADRNLEAGVQSWLTKLENYETVIVGGFGLTKRRSESYGVSRNMSELVRNLGTSPTETILIWCGNPYALRFFGREQATIVAYEDAQEAQVAAAQAVFGGIRVTGRLPVSVSARFPEGAGIQIRRPTRFGFAIPEEVGMDTPTLQRIDSLAFHYINRKAMPGCAILVMRGNDIVYHRGFGRVEYGASAEMIDPLEHSYDLASITKVAATTLSTMRLTEQGRLDLDVPIYRYLPEWRSIDKGRLTCRQLLQHSAGLPGWEPLFLETYSDPKRKIIDRERFRFEASNEYPLPVGPGLYARADMETWVWDKIAEVELSSSRRIRYSDVGMMILGHVVERVAGESLESYSRSQFFNPLGMSRTWFQPGEKGLAAHCPPTEADYDWRHSVVRGYVHDPNAALLGGIAGHAGLFSNIYDLGKVLMMLKNQGNYANRRFFLPATIETFTKKQLSYSRKGLGWDKPDLGGGSTPTSSMASASTFGHTGFTGTCAWVDPQSDVVFVFLSNRTFPKASNKLLQRDNVRVQMMDQVYLAIKAYQRKARRYQG